MSSLDEGLGGDGFEVGHLLFSGDGGLEGGSAAGEDVESEVAAAFGLFVVLPGEDGADHPSARGAARSAPPRP